MGDAPALVLGDLNALSPLDAAVHEAAGLAQRLRSLSRPRRKFMTLGKLDYSPMQALLDVGLADPIRQGGRRPPGADGGWSFLVHFHSAGGGPISLVFLQKA